MKNCNECPYIRLEEDAIGKTGKYICFLSNELIHNVMVIADHCLFKDDNYGKNTSLKNITANTNTDTNDDFKPCCGTGE